MKRFKFVSSKNIAHVMNASTSTAKLKRGQNVSMSLFSGSAHALCNMKMRLPDLTFVSVSPTSRPSTENVFVCREGSGSGIASRPFG